jgi:hypothetical protein
MNRQAEKKVPRIEERLALLKKSIGVNKFNRETETSKVPKGSYIHNSIASGDNIRRWATAMGDLNPRFLVSEYASNTKYGRLVAPPLFLQSVCFVGTGMLETEIQGARGFHSGSEWEFFQPVLEDDRLDFNGIGLIDAKAVKSKFSNQMIVMTGICQYRNQRRENIGLVKGFVHSSAGDEVALNTGKYDEIAKPYRYSDEELRKIEEDKQKEEIRGDQPRYWEDVIEGESLGNIVIGPHTIMDTIAHISGTQGCFALGGTGSRITRKWIKNMQLKGSDKGPEIYDPRINAYVNGELAHLDYDLGRATAAPGAYDTGAERECVASILLTNWIGDDGFLWKYSIQFRKFIVHGDTDWFGGRVKRKYIDDGKYCLDIEHWGDNQRKERTTIGSATVILPSKVHGPVKYPTPRSVDDVFPLQK